jgi:hypothetical protein
MPRLIGAVDKAKTDPVGAKARPDPVPHCDALVAVNVAGLLFGGELLRAPVHREHQVGLLDDLPAVQLEVFEHVEIQLPRGPAPAPPGKPPRRSC